MPPTCLVVGLSHRGLWLGSSSHGCGGRGWLLIILFAVVRHRWGGGSNVRVGILRIQNRETTCKCMARVIELISRVKLTMYRLLVYSSRIKTPHLHVQYIQINALEKINLLS